MVGSEDKHMGQMKRQFWYLWNVVFLNEILLFMFLVAQFLFVCILFYSCQSSPLWNTLNIFFICGMDVSREQYYVKNYGKHKIIFLDTCLLYLYFTPDWVGQYLGTFHNSVTHISSAVDHAV